jgi:hypothetical protein
MIEPVSCGVKTKAVSNRRLMSAMGQSRDFGHFSCVRLSTDRVENNDRKNFASEAIHSEVGYAFNFNQYVPAREFREVPEADSRTVTAAPTQRSAQIVIGHFAEPQCQVGNDVRCREDLQHRQFGDRRQCVRMKLKRARSGPGAF